MYLPSDSPKQFAVDQDYMPSKSFFSHTDIDSPSGSFQQFDIGNGIVDIFSIPNRDHKKIHENGSGNTIYTDHLNADLGFVSSGGNITILGILDGVSGINYNRVPDSRKLASGVINNFTPIDPTGLSLDECAESYRLSLLSADLSEAPRGAVRGTIVMIDTNSNDMITLTIGKHGTPSMKVDYGIAEDFPSSAAQNEFCIDTGDLTTAISIERTYMPDLDFATLILESDGAHHYKSEKMTAESIHSIAPDDDITVIRYRKNPRQKT